MSGEARQPPHLDGTPASQTPASGAAKDEDWISDREMWTVLSLGCSLWVCGIAFLVWGAWSLVLWLT